MNLEKFANQLRLLLVVFTFSVISNQAFGEATQEVSDDTSIASLGYKSSMVNLNGLQFHTIEKGQGEPILFLHGFPFDSETWLPIMEPLSENYHTVAIDNRGYPRSDKPESIDDYHISKLVSDVAAFVESKFPEQQITVVGHDWGATLAWTYAQKHPEQVAKLITLNAPPYNIFLKMLAENEQQQAASTYIPRLKSDEFEQMLVKNGAASVWGFGYDKLHESGALDDAFKARFFKAWNEPGAIRGGINWYRANIPDNADITDEHYWPSKDARNTVPSLLLWSDGEVAFIKETIEEIKGLSDQLTVIEVANAGHFLQLQYPEQVVGHITEFLQSADAPQE